MDSRLPSQVSTKLSDLKRERVCGVERVEDIYSKAQGQILCTCEDRLQSNQNTCELLVTLYIYALMIS